MPVTTSWCASNTGQKNFKDSNRKVAVSVARQTCACNCLEQHRSAWLWVEILCKFQKLEVVICCFLSRTTCWRGWLTSGSSRKRVGEEAIEFRTADIGRKDESQSNFLIFFEDCVRSKGPTCQAACLDVSCQGTGRSAASSHQKYFVQIMDCQVGRLVVCTIGAAMLLSGSLQLACACLIKLAKRRSVTSVLRRGRCCGRRRSHIEVQKAGPPCSSSRCGWFEKYHRDCT